MLTGRKVRILGCAGRAALVGYVLGDVPIESRLTLDNLSELDEDHSVT